MLFKLFLGSLAAFTVSVMGYAIYKETTCARREDQSVYHEAWTQFIPINDTLIPVFHNAYWSIESVCVEYAE